MTDSKLFLSLDLETTGLDPVNDKILEVGWQVLDEHLWAITEVHSQIVWPTAYIWSAFNNADPYVKAMHTKSGLLTDLTEALADETPNLPGIENQVLASIASAAEKVSSKLYDDESIPVHLLGFSVHFDRSFIDVHMRRLAKRLHHRILDASSLKLLAEASGLTVPEPTNSHPHRAGFDVAEARDYVYLFQGETRIAFTPKEA